MGDVYTCLDAPCTDATDSEPQVGKRNQGLSAWIAPKKMLKDLTVVQIAVLYLAIGMVTVFNFAWCSYWAYGAVKEPHPASLPMTKDVEVGQPEPSSAGQVVIV